MHIIEVEKWTSFIHKENKNSSMMSIITNILDRILLILCPLAMIIVGGIYVDECELDKRIPIYLIVQGITFLLIRVLYSRESMETYNFRFWLFGITLVFFVTWFLLGTICIYRALEPNFDPTAGPQCHKGLYEFAFWVNTTYLVIFALILCLHDVCYQVNQW